MTTVLVAGFGPFPGEPKNSSGDLARALGRRRRPALAGVRIVSAVLPTTYAAAHELPALLAKHDPDLVLFFGVAGRSRFVRIETRAVNAASALHPDAARAKPGRRAVVNHAPTELAVRAPVQRLAAAARTAGVPVRLSRDAGRYLCNAAFFISLDAARRKARPRGLAFVHIPRPRSPIPLGRRRARRPAATALVRAGEAILVALLAGARRA